MSGARKIETAVKPVLQRGYYIDIDRGNWWQRYCQKTLRQRLKLADRREVANRD